MKVKASIYYIVAYYSLRHKKWRLTFMPVVCKTIILFVVIFHNINIWPKVIQFVMAAVKINYYSKNNATSDSYGTPRTTVAVTVK